MKTIKVGMVGARGMALALGFMSSPNVEITALCNLDEVALADEAKRLGVKNTYRVYEDMLASDIDAVVIATPMQCHVPQAIAALEAGKHVLSEVTAGVTMDELFWLCETVEKYKKVYMLAENYIYMPKIQAVKAMVNAGLFGECYYAEGMYLHNIDQLMKYKNGQTSWRSYWQCGVRGSFYPTHSLGPVMQWFPGDRVSEISCFSPGIYSTSGLKQDSGTTTMCRMASGKFAQIRVDCVSPRPHRAAYYHLQGTKGAFETKSCSAFGDQDKVSFVSETNPTYEMKWQPLTDFNDYLPERYRNATEEQLKAGHWGGDFFIVDDFIRAIRTGEKPAIDVYEACEWTAVALLSSISVANNGRTMDIPHFRKNMPVEEKIIKL